MSTVARRLLYFGYYLRRLDWVLLEKFMAYVKTEKGWSRARQWRAIVQDSLKFNISPLEYYQFRFFDLAEAGKSSWAGTGTMYEFQRVANPPATRGILHDKRRFYREYRKLFRHELHALSDMRSSPAILQELINKNNTLVFKEATGNCGAGVSFKSTVGWTPEATISYMQKNGFDLVETFVKQHSDMNALSPSGVNTVRIFTQITRAGEYQVLGCRLRISVNSRIDNLAAGNIAAPIDYDSGIVNGPGVYSNITREPEEVHPVTGHPIPGFQVPFWLEILDLVRKAALLHPENRSIGWDVVVTDEGPGLIEGNHDWCKLVWQLPVNRGLKHLLDHDW